MSAPLTRRDADLCTDLLDRPADLHGQAAGGAEVAVVIRRGKATAQVGALFCEQHLAPLICEQRGCTATAHARPQDNCVVTLLQRHDLSDLFDYVDSGIVTSGDPTGHPDQSIRELRCGTATRRTMDFDVVCVAAGFAADTNTLTRKPAAAMLPPMNLQPDNRRRDFCPTGTAAGQ